MSIRHPNSITIKLWDFAYHLLQLLQEVAQIYWYQIFSPKKYTPSSNRPQISPFKLISVFPSSYSSNYTQGCCSQDNVSIKRHVDGYSSIERGQRSSYYATCSLIVRRKSSWKTLDADADLICFGVIVAAMMGLHLLSGDLTAVLSGGAPESQLKSFPGDRAFLQMPAYVDWLEKRARDTGEAFWQPQMRVLQSRIQNLERFAINGKRMNVVQYFNGGLHMIKKGADYHPWMGPAYEWCVWFLLVLMLYIRLNGPRVPTAENQPFKELESCLWGSTASLLGLAPALPKSLEHCDVFSK